MQTFIRRKIIMETIDKVVEAFKSSKEPLSAGEIVKITGIDKKEVDKALNKLKKEEKIISPKRCYWTLK